MSTVRHLRRRARLIAVATGLALGAPAATAVAQPSDAGPVAPAGHSSVVVRAPASTPPAVTPSPDARDAALAATAATPVSRSDPRSPDARDAGSLVVRGLRSPTAPASSSVIVRDDTDTTLPLALAGSALVIALLAAAGVGQVTRSRRQSVSVGS